MIAALHIFFAAVYGNDLKNHEKPKPLQMRACPAHGRLVSRISVGTEGELKEYTYVMENRDMPKTVLEDVDTETWRFGW